MIPINRLNFSDSQRHESVNLERCAITSTKVRIKIFPISQMMQYKKYFRCTMSNSVNEEIRSANFCYNDNTLIAYTLKNDFGGNDILPSSKGVKKISYYPS